MGGTADGDERAQRDLNDSRVEPLHPNCCGLWRSLHRRSVCPRRLHGSHRVWHWYSAGCDHYLPILWDLRERTERNGQHGCPTLLNLHHLFCYYCAAQLLEWKTSDCSGTNSEQLQDTFLTLRPSELCIF